MIKQIIKRLIPHACIVLGLFILTFVILAQFNPWFYKPFFSIALGIFSVVAIITAGFLIASNLKERKDRKSRG